MTVTLFATLLAIGAIVNALLTEAIKKAYKNAGKAYSPNLVALIDATVIGGLGTAAVYMLLGVPWNVNNIICLCIMIVTVWVASMIGYDKVLQLAQQIEKITTIAEKNTAEKKEGAENGNNGTD